MKEKKAKVAMDVEPPMEITLLASHIRDISESVKRMRSGKIKDRAIILLIHDSLPSSSRVSKRDIADVMDAMDDLAKTYLK